MHGAEPQPTFYALEPTLYTCKNALRIMPCSALATAHWEAKSADGASRTYKVIHFLAALVECLPIIGQVAALFELAVVRGVRCCAYIFASKPKANPPSGGFVGTKQTPVEYLTRQIEDPDNHVSVLKVPSTARLSKKTKEYLKAISVARKLGLIRNPRFHLASSALFFLCGKSLLQEA